MQTTTQDPELDARPLSEIVESPRAVLALDGAGFKTLGDVRQHGLSALHDIRWVGEASIGFIAAALGPQLMEDEESRDGEDAEIEEGEHPIRIASPHTTYQIKLLDANRVDRQGGGYSLQRNVFLKFEGGDAAMDKKMWLTLKFMRDEGKIASAMADARFPWRREACAYLKTVVGFGRDFHILGD